MFTLSAQYYDKIYAFKDYRGEVEKLAALLSRYSTGRTRQLLDVACGTGKHLEYLRNYFDVSGLDIEGELLEVARARLPGVPLYLGDMAEFNLGIQYDVITCLFSAIGYLKTLDRVKQAVQRMADHLKPGGVLVVEPWLTPAVWKPGTVHATLVDEPELKIARVSTSLVDGRLSYFDLHYLIGTPQGTQHIVERHELGLFEIQEQLDIFSAVGLEASFDPEGLTGRGLLIGVKAR